MIIVVRYQKPEYISREREKERMNEKEMRYILFLLCNLLFCYDSLTVFRKGKMYHQVEVTGEKTNVV